MLSLSRIMAILYKELLQLKRDKMTFGMVVMIPLVQLVLFGYAINTNVRDIPVGVVDQARNGLSATLIDMVQATQVVRVTQYYDDIETAEAEIRAARISAVLIIPHDLAARVARSPAIGLESPPTGDRPSARPVAQWVVDGSDTVVAGAIKSLRAMPLTEVLRRPPNAQTPTFETTLLYNPAQRTVVNIVPGLVAVILTMTMVMFTSAAIVREREQGNLEMIINTPVRSMELMLGKIAPFLVIGLLQVALILGLGRLLFSIPFNGSLLTLTLATILFIVASLTLGLVLSTIARTQLQSMQMTIFILLPSILLSGFMFPYEGMPEVAQWIAEALPATHFMRMIRGVVLRDASLLEMYRDALWLTGFCIAGLGIAALRFKKHLD